MFGQGSAAQDHWHVLSMCLLLGRPLFSLYHQDMP